MFFISSTIGNVSYRVKSGLLLAHARFSQTYAMISQIGSIMCSIEDLWDLSPSFSRLASCGNAVEWRRGVFLLATS